MRILTALLFCCLSLNLHAAEPAKASDAKAKRAPNPVMYPIQDVAGLPRVLLIGDSISIGYTVPTRKLLEGKANVHRIPTNGGPSSNGVAGITDDATL